MEETDAFVEWSVTLNVDWASFAVRRYHFSDAGEYEVEWIVGPIPVDDKRGKEAVLIYNSGGIENGGVFHTDANGRQMVERRRDFRTFDFEHGDEEPAASNYYPVTSAIYIEDESSGARMTVAVDRSEGGASLQDGQLELMLHRRTLLSDRVGVYEPLDEVSHGEGLVARGLHLVKLSSGGEEEAEWRRAKMQESYLRPTVTFSGTDLTAEEWVSTESPREFSALSADLPANVNVATVERWRGGDDVLVRLENAFQAGEHSQLSADVSLNLDTLFTDLDFDSATEMTLGGNVELDNLERLSWKKATTTSTETDDQKREFDGSTVDLAAMDIRTFLLSSDAGAEGNSADAARGFPSLVMACLVAGFLLQRRRQA